MISEVDLRDWDKVDFKKIKDGLANTQHVSPDYLAVAKKFLRFVETMELIRDNQFKRVPKLLQKDQ